MPTRLLLPALLLLAGAIAAAFTVAASSSLDAMRAGASLPGVNFGHHVTVASLDQFDASRFVQGEPIDDINEARLERQSQLALRTFAGGGASGRPPAALAGIQHGAQARAIRRAFDGIPRGEIELSARVFQPHELMDPWRVEVLVDVRDIGASSPGFSTPRTAVELQLRPFGDAGRGIVRRWHVESMKLERGGLLLLARDVSYVRHGRVGVLAPTPELATARSIAADADRMLPELVRRYPRMRPAGHGAFIVLAPSSGRASKVMSTLDRGTLDHAAGVATSERNVSISLDAWHGMMGIERQSLLRHELTHLATVTLARSGYQLYTEGIAEWEGDHEIVRTGRYYLKNDSAIAGVRSGALDLDKLLFEQDAMEGLGADKWKAYRLGAQVAEYLDSTYGHDRTVKFLAMIGTERDVRVAVRRVLHTSPGAYRSSVERWVVAHPTWMG